MDQSDIDLEAFEDAYGTIQDARTHYQRIYDKLDELLSDCRVWLDWDWDRYNKKLAKGDVTEHVSNTASALGDAIGELNDSVSIVRTDIDRALGDLSLCFEECDEHLSRARSNVDS